MPDGDTLVVLFAEGRTKAERFGRNGGSWRGPVNHDEGETARRFLNDRQHRPLHLVNEYPSPSKG